MKRSETAIRTSHAGRLPPVGAAAGNYASWSPRSAGGPVTEDTGLLVRQVADVIKKQVGIGISCVGDGEFWNGRNFGYYAQQFGGVTTRPLKQGEKGSGHCKIFAKVYDYPSIWNITTEIEYLPVPCQLVAHLSGFYWFE